MDREKVSNILNIHIYVYIHILDFYSAIRKIKLSHLLENRTGDHYAKPNKLD